MILFLLILSVLCLSGYSIVYSLSPPDRATVAGTPAQDEAALLAAERDRFDELVAGLGLQAPGGHPGRHDSTDRHRHSVNTITSDALDALYAERDRLRQQLDDRADDMVAALVEEAVEQAAELRGQLADVETKSVGLYRERAHLLGWLAFLHPHDAFLTAATDVDEPGWKLLHLGIAGHRLCWHIAPRDVELFDHVTTVPFTDLRVRRDGSTTDAKYRRIRSLTLGQKSAAVRTPAPETGHSGTRTMAAQSNIDALLDGYAHRGMVIQQALRLVDTVIDAPSTAAAEQRPIHDFAHRIRRALLVTSPRTGI